MKNIISRTELFYKEGTSDKVYNVWIEAIGGNYWVKFQYGRRGSTLTNGTKVGPTHSAAAKDCYLKIVNEKTDKGYKVKVPEKKSTMTTKERMATMGIDVDETDGITATAMKKIFMEAVLDPKLGIKIDDTGMPVSVPEPPFPGDKFIPQLLNPINESELEGFINDPDYIFQEKHDGRRMMLGHSLDSPVVAWNRKGEKIDPPEEFAQTLRSCFGEYEFVIDGEACGDKFFAFDVLMLEKQDCRDVPYEDRLGNLGMLIRSAIKQDTIVLVDGPMQLPDAKRTFIEHIRGKKGEGFVIKNKNAKYSAGRPNSGGSQLKFKFIESASCVVNKINDKRSVELCLIGPHQFGKDRVPLVVGNVTIPPNHDVPAVGDVVEVRYLYAFKGGSLYQPVYLGKRTDISKDECTTEQLKYKPDPEDEDKLPDPRTAPQSMWGDLESLVMKMAKEKEEMKKIKPDDALTLGLKIGENIEAAKTEEDRTSLIKKWSGVLRNLGITK